MTTPESAWDDLLDRLDHCADSHPTLEELVALVSAAQSDGLADAELDAVDCGRWLQGLIQVHAGMDDVGDRALSTLRVMVTRWLHPPRLDLALAARSQAR